MLGAPSPTPVQPKSFLPPLEQRPPLPPGGDMPPHTRQAPPSVTGTRTAGGITWMLKWNTSPS